MHIVFGILTVLQMIFAVGLILSNNTIMLVAGAVLWSGGIISLMLLSIRNWMEVVRPK